MIEENRIYKRKSDGKFCFVEKYSGGTIHGLFVNEYCVPVSGFTATIENFEKSVYKTPVTITNTTLVDNKELKSKDSKVLYKNAVICYSVKDNEYGIDTRCLNYDTAHNSMGRIVSETKSMGYSNKYTYSVVDLKHKIGA